MKKRMFRFLLSILILGILTIQACPLNEEKCNGQCSAVHAPIAGALSVQTAHESGCVKKASQKKIPEVCLERAKLEKAKVELLKKSNQKRGEK